MSPAPLNDTPYIYDSPGAPGGEADGEGDQHVDVINGLIRRMESPNLAEEVEETERGKLAIKVCREYEIDEDSREPWRRRTEAGMKLALQKNAAKTFPWANAANIQFPLMTSAAIQFAARAYPAIISGQDVVKAQVTGADPAGEKRARADRIAAHMSWQLLTEMTDWEPSVDTMLHALPLMGCAFKKTYFDPIKGRNCSDYVSAFDFCVNSAAASIDTAPRETHIIRLYPYQIEERIRSGLFLDFDYSGPPSNQAQSNFSSVTKAEPDASDEDAPREFLEQKRRIDLDEDGYPEPYLVTVHRDTEKVCRIVACFDEDGIHVDPATGQVMSITPRRYFTKVPFIPNPEGGFYDVGFAWLLSPLNKAIDTLINQLLDAGTLSNTGGGFIGNQLRLKGGTLRFQPGEYKEVDVPGGTVKENIVSLTFPGPSEVLLKLLQLLIDAGREVASVKDVLTGEMPAASTPATTTLAMIEQGLKVFTAIWKRIHRALKDEFGKLYALNRKYFDPIAYAAFTDMPEVSEEDYKGDPVDIIPISDPAMVSDMQKLARAEALKGLLGLGTLDPGAVTRRILEAMGTSEVEELLPKQQGPDPQALAAFAELEAKIADMEAATELKYAQAFAAIENAKLLDPQHQLAVYEAFLKTMVAHSDAKAAGGGGLSMPKAAKPPAEVPGSGPPPPPARALGGPVLAGQPYTVGELGIETFVPAQDGMILPAAAPLGVFPERSEGFSGSEGLGFSGSGGWGGGVQLAANLEQLAGAKQRALEKLVQVHKQTKDKASIAAAEKALNDASALYVQALQAAQAAQAAKKK